MTGEGLGQSPPGDFAASREVSGVEAVAWGALSVAVSNAIRIATFELPAGGVAARALHHVIELGHTLFVATVVAAIVMLWTRFGPRRKAWGALLVWVVSALVAQVVLTEDAQGPLEQLGGDPESALQIGAMCAAAAMPVAVAFVFGRIAARPRVRWIAIAAGAAIILVNPHTLQGGYSGTHLLFAAIGAMLLSSALVGFRRPRIARVRWPPVATPVALGVSALIGFIAAAVRPPSLVELELGRLESAILAPWLGEFRQAVAVSDVPVPPEMVPWFERRNKRPPVPPNPRRLLPEGPIVILYTIDAFRHDLMKQKYRDVAPNVHAMRETSVYFSEARSFGAGTRISLAAVFAGRYYSMLKWTRPLSKRPTLERDHRPRFPDLLTMQDVDTVNVTSLQGMLTEEFGIVRGFSEELRRRKDEDQRMTADLTEQAIERLKRQGPDPLFLFMHVIDPHKPYRTYGKRVDSQRDAYHLEVTLSDSSLGRIRRAVEELGLKHRTAFIVSSDHGEGFGENRVYDHNKTVYDVMVHVPLLIEIPGLKPRTIDDYVSVMDVGPTILDLFGVPTPGFWMAESLVPQLLGAPAPKGRPLVMETRREMGMLFPDGVKAIVDWENGIEELYDLRRDPAEKRNLRDELRSEADGRLSLLRKYFRVHAGRRQNGEPF